MTDEERAKARAERDREYVEDALKSWTKAGYECRAVGVRPFAIGMRVAKDAQVELLFTDYSDNGTSSAYLTAEDLDWIAATGKRLLSAPGR